nr:immunoglobulin heavy chain junction region [Macaca mulatta]
CVRLMGVHLIYFDYW